MKHLIPLCLWLPQLSRDEEEEEDDFSITLPAEELVRD